MRVTHAYRRRLFVDVMTWPSAGATRSCPAELERQTQVWRPDRWGAERATFLVVKLVRAFGGCLGSKRR
jgi:hypothetical protein